MVREEISESLLIVICEFVESGPDSLDDAARVNSGFHGLVGLYHFEGQELPELVEPRSGGLVVEAVLDLEDSDDGLRPNSFGVDLPVNFADGGLLLLVDGGRVLALLEVFVLADLEGALLAVLADDGPCCCEEGSGVEVFAGLLSLGTGGSDERRNLLWCGPDGCADFVCVVFMGIHWP